ncbi:DNase I-like protein [Basidiobolus meristosporus CBS 931.73]|uniref:DNase I-like protein n=1 Tax=Basidiobolus meristosporus CBS 931.73 TaxID=1314790 RepID=A0A1Y1X895_9FUNG|nr:DNase I-like protein [Basidiobolus meristosporus CBS 931.73]|eukprot:ORX81626.1 DNase I-like protein [Basidiobolus meristosporus CBS 931.73]
MEASKFHVLVGTFNVYQQNLNEQISDWLASPFKEHAKVLPDIVAVGFQEFSTYPQAFIRKDETRLNYVEGLIEQTLGKLGEILGDHTEKEYRNTSYRRVFVEQVVGLALMVFVKSTLHNQVSELSSNHEGSGPLFIQNKGALGVSFRITPKSIGEPEGTFCFVCAHFSAHEGYAWRRNIDFKHLAERLVFPKHPDSVEATDFRTFHEFDHVFLFGDLNYRVKYNTKEISKPDITKTILSLINEGDLISLRQYDELTFEKKEGRTVRGFTEGHPLDFPPTYKFNVGSQEYKWKARIPSWCDRILYFDPGDYNTELSSEKVATSPITTLYYSSYAPATISDHKPVVGLYEVEARSAPLDLSHITWPSIDPYWRSKQSLGKVLTKAAGVLWYVFGTEKWITVVLCIVIYRLYKML